MKPGWTFGGRARTRRDDAGRFVRPDGTRRRKRGRSGRAGSGALAMLESEQLADRLVTLEDECELFRVRCGQPPLAAKRRTRDCQKIHSEMNKTCTVLGDIVRELVEAEPEVTHQPRKRLADLLLEKNIVLAPRSLGRWPYKDAIEAAMVVKLACPQSREARVRKRQRELSRRMLIWLIGQSEAERDGLDTQCAALARNFAKALQPLD